MPEYLKSHTAYEFCCPSKYIAKTDPNYGTRVQEHSGSDKKSPVYNHLLECKHFNDVVNLHSLIPSNSLVEYLENVNPIVHGTGEGGEFTSSVGFFLITFFFTEAKSLEFSDFTFLFFTHNVVKFP